MTHFPEKNPYTNEQRPDMSRSPLQRTYMEYPEGQETQAGNSVGPWGYTESPYQCKPKPGENPQKPLVVTHVGPCLMQGGAEHHLRDLLRFLNPHRVAIGKCIVAEDNFIDPDAAADLPVPIEVGQAEAVRKAARESDVILYWGLEIGKWLEGCRPALCVYLAHGESHWTRHVLEASAEVTDHVIAVSQRVRERVCAGFPATVIHNGVDAARLAQSRSRPEMRESLGFTDGDFVLGFVGRFSGEKRPERIIETVARLPRRFKALIVGWGAMKEELMELANARIPGRYVFATARNHLGDYYQAMDSLCLLSEHEGFGLVILEAMMCGRPVIATNVGCVPEIIRDRINGIVVPDDLDAVCGAVEELYRHPHWARGLAEEGHTYALQHGHALQMATRYESLLEQLWNAKHAAA
jgi:glycosyltransferase involved in cell wall biosynthesis